MVLKTIDNNDDDKDKQPNASFMFETISINNKMGAGCVAEAIRVKKQRLIKFNETKITTLFHKVDKEHVKSTSNVTPADNSNKGNEHIMK